MVVEGKGNGCSKTITTYNLRHSIFPGYYQLALGRPHVHDKSKWRIRGNKVWNKIIMDIFHEFKLVKRNYNTNRIYPIGILKLLDKIICNSYYGGVNRHRQLLYRIVKKILTQSDAECIYLDEIIVGVDCDLLPWLKDVPFDMRQKTLLKSHIFVLDAIVKPLITFFYKPIQTRHGQEIVIYSRDVWNRLESRAFNRMRKLKHIEEVADRSLLMISRGRLVIVPKTKSYRAIVYFNKKNPHVNMEKYKILKNKIIANEKEISIISQISQPLYDKWVEFVKASEKRPIFGVKLDLADAFGNIKIDVLSRQIDNVTFLTSREKQFVLNHIRQQYMTFRCDKDGPKVWKWTHGLIQGDQLSAPLCELYLSNFDRQHLTQFARNGENFIHRTVDDYFFCSTDQQQVERFLTLITATHTLNMEKIVTNYGQYRNCRIGQDDCIPYCGKLFNLKTRHVKTLHDFRDKFVMRNQFRMWNYSKQINGDDFVMKFIDNTMRFSICMFNKIELNTVYNSEERVLLNFFDSMILMAYKFDCAFMAVADISDLTAVLLFELLVRVILRYSAFALHIIDSNRGDYHRGTIVLTILLKIAFNALVLVLQRRSITYAELIEVIKSEENLYVHLPSGMEHVVFNKIPRYFQGIKLNRATKL